MKRKLLLLATLVAGLTQSPGTVAQQPPQQSERAEQDLRWCKRRHGKHGTGIQFCMRSRGYEYKNKQWIPRENAE